jgi:GT2 family glycosyltransferase
MTAPVFVVLVNFNGWSDTIECLESVLRSDYPNTRVVVVDNGSRDDSIARLVEWAKGERRHEPESTALRHLSWPPVAKDFQFAVVDLDRAAAVLEGPDVPVVTFIETRRNLGFAGGNNVALRALMSSRWKGYACLINNDMVIAPHALSALANVAGIEGDSAAVGGVILEYDRPQVVEAVSGGSMSRLGMAETWGAGLPVDQVRAPAALGYISGGCLLMSLEMLRRVGVMDERYFLYAEDADWGERMRNAGYRLACAVDAHVWHKGSRATGARSPFQDYYLVRSTLMFVRAHAPRLVPVAAAYSVIRSLLPKLMRLQWPRAKAVLRAYADYARGI